MRTQQLPIVAEKVILNPWATLVTRDTSVATTSTRKRKMMLTMKEKEDLLTLKEEEAYLRTRCFHILAKRMDRIMENSMKSQVSWLLEELNTFLDMSSSSPVEKKEVDGRMDKVLGRRKRKRQKLMMATGADDPCSFGYGSDDNHEDSDRHDDAGDNDHHAIEDPLREACRLLTAHCTRTDPRLLPIALIKGPAFDLDRCESMNFLFQTLRMSRKRSCAVWLQKAHRSRGASSSPSSSSSSWMQELLRQCLDQESHILSSPQVRSKLEKKASITEVLILWAQHSIAFDNIVIFLEIEDVMYGPELQDFLCALALRRSEYGLPLNVILLCPHEGRRALEFRSWAQGTCGFVTKTFALPSSVDFFDCFWKYLMTEKFPVLPPSSVLLSIRQSFDKQKSSVRAIMKLKQSLAYFFTSPGSFLSVAFEKQILDEEWPRIAWFCLNPEARTIILPDATSGGVGASMTHFIREMQLSHEKARMMRIIMSEIVATENDGGILSFCLKRDDHTRSAASVYSRKQILHLLLRLRQQYVQQVELELEHELEQEQGQTPRLPDKLMKRYVDPLGMQSGLEDQKEIIVNLLNELIILFGRCDDLSSLAKGLLAMLDEWIVYPSETAAPQTSNGSNLDWNAFIESMSPEPRRSIAAGLLSEMSSSNAEICLVNVAGAMFCLIHDRVSISQSEWLVQLWDNLPNQKISQKEVFALFSCGLRYLKTCGLVLEKRLCGRNVVYEKAKLVWCSGDIEESTS